MSSNIHATAVINRGAEIDSSAVIGAYSIIGKDVKLAAHVEIGSHTIIEGITSIGSHTRIGHFASIGGAPQDMKYKGEPTTLVIGERNTIREFTTIHVGTGQGKGKGLTKIGNDNWIMSYVHIAHDCIVGDHTIFSSNAQIAGHVQVDDWAILGGMSGVHQFVRLGAHSMLGGASALVQDLPPFVIAAGEKAEAKYLNSEGLKRRGFSPEVIEKLKKVFRIYRNELFLEQAIEKISNIPCDENVGKKEIDIFLNFLNTSERGVIRCAKINRIKNNESE